MYNAQFNKLNQQIIQEDKIQYGNWKDDEEQSGFRVDHSYIDNNNFCRKQITRKKRTTWKQTHKMFIDIQKVYV